MSIYAIADLHLSFSAEKPMDIFGGQWTNHVTRLSEIWRRIIKEEDTVIVPGDISWSMKMEGAIPDLDWIAALPGKKVLIKGNHDLWWISVTKLNSLYENIRFLQNDFWRADGIAICGSRGWIGPRDQGFTEQDEKVYNRELLRLRMSLEAAVLAREQRIIGALHFSPFSESGEDSGFTKLFEEFGVEKVVYGHLHGPDAHRKAAQGLRNGVEYQLVSCDYLACCPLLLHEGN